MVESELGLNQRLDAVLDDLEAAIDRAKKTRQNVVEDNEMSGVLDRIERQTDRSDRE